MLVKSLQLRAPRPWTDCSESSRGHRVTKACSQYGTISDIKAVTSCRAALYEYTPSQIPLSTPNPPRVPQSRWLRPLQTATGKTIATGAIDHTDSTFLFIK